MEFKRDDRVEVLGNGYRGTVEHVAISDHPGIPNEVLVTLDRPNTMLVMNEERGSIWLYANALTLATERTENEYKAAACRECGSTRVHKHS